MSYYTHIVFIVLCIVMNSVVLTTKRFKYGLYIIYVTFPKIEGLRPNLPSKYIGHQTFKYEYNISSDL